MGMGCSYSLLDVNQIDFVRTSPLRKFLRLILGLSIFIMIKVIFDLTSGHYIGINKFIYYHAVPNFLASFFIYGPYLVLCKKLDLVGYPPVKEVKSVHERAKIVEGFAKMDKSV